MKRLHESILLFAGRHLVQSTDESIVSAVLPNEYANIATP